MSYNRAPIGVISKYTPDRQRQAEVSQQRQPNYQVQHSGILSISFHGDPWEHSLEQSPASATIKSTLRSCKFSRKNSSKCRSDVLNNLIQLKLIRQQLSNATPLKSILAMSNNGRLLLQKHCYILRSSFKPSKKRLL